MAAQVMPRSRASETASLATSRPSTARKTSSAARGSGDPRVTLQGRHSWANQPLVRQRGASLMAETGALRTARCCRGVESQPELV